MNEFGLQLFISAAKSAEVKRVVVTTTSGPIPIIKLPKWDAAHQAFILALIEYKLSYKGGPKFEYAEPPGRSAAIFVEAGSFYLKEIGEDDAKRICTGLGKRDGLKIFPDCLPVANVEFFEIKIDEKGKEIERRKMSPADLVALKSTIFGMWKENSKWAQRIAREELEEKLREIAIRESKLDKGEAEHQHREGELDARFQIYATQEKRLWEEREQIQKDGKAKAAENAHLVAERESLQAKVDIQNEQLQSIQAAKQKLASENEDLHAEKQELLRARTDNEKLIAKLQQELEHYGFRTKVGAMIFAAAIIIPILVLLADKVRLPNANKTLSDIKGMLMFSRWDQETRMHLNSVFRWDTQPVSPPKFLTPTEITTVFVETPTNLMESPEIKVQLVEFSKIGKEEPLTFRLLSSGTNQVLFLIHPDDSPEQISGAYIDTGDDFKVYNHSVKPLDQLLVIAQYRFPIFFHPLDDLDPHELFGSYQIVVVNDFLRKGASITNTCAIGTTRMKNIQAAACYDFNTDQTVLNRMLGHPPGLDDLRFRQVNQSPFPTDQIRMFLKNKIVPILDKIQSAPVPIKDFSKTDFAKLSSWVQVMSTTTNSVQWTTDRSVQKTSRLYVLTN